MAATICNCLRCGQPFTRGEYRGRGVCYTCRPRHTNPPKPRPSRLRGPAPVTEWDKSTQFEDSPISAGLEKTR